MPRRRRRLSLTPELVALVERTEPDPGPEPGTGEHDDAEIAAWAQAVLDENPDDGLRLFAYGSLIWNPEFEVLSSARAVAYGWRRAFCMRLTRWRGTRETPALMMALDRGGSCAGVLYELPPSDRAAQIARLLVREIDAKPATNVPRWIWVETAVGRFRALAFVADRSGPAYAAGVPIEEVARITARAAGHWGSAAAYLQRTVAQLEAHRVHDRALWRLQELVAREILANR